MRTSIRFDREAADEFARFLETVDRESFLADPAGAAGELKEQVDQDKIRPILEALVACDVERQHLEVLLDLNELARTRGWPVTGLEVEEGEVVFMVL